jgi:putative exporter of polyketide antibiotics
VTALSFRLELRRSRILAVGLAVVVLVYGGLIAALYPILLANTAQIEDYMKLFPKGFMAAFGITGSLADPGIFFTTYIGNFLWPIVAAIGAIVLATRPTASDAERGWADLPLATPLTRGRYLGAAILGQVVVLAALASGACWRWARSSGPASTSPGSLPPASFCGSSRAPSPA